MKKNLFLYVFILRNRETWYFWHIRIKKDKITWTFSEFLYNFAMRLQYTERTKWSVQLYN